MNDIQNFAFEGNLVRVVERNDETWFVAADVCRALDLKGDAGQHTRNLDADEVLTLTTDDTPLPNNQGQAGHGGARQYVVISEPGVYRLVFRSRKPEAERFKRWLAHEVLPQIRKTGAYIPAESQPAFEVDIAHAPLGSKVEYLRLVRKEFGRPAMLHVYRQINLPALPQGIEAQPAGAFQPREALAQLLGHELDGQPIRHWLSEAFASSAQARAKLIDAGIRIEDDCFAVANTHPAIRAIFQRTRWWPAYPHLRDLEGARTFKPAKYGKGFTSHGTLIPVYWLDPETMN